MKPYDHSRLERKRHILRWMIDNIGFRYLVKIDRVDGLDHFPQKGSAIIMMNHIAFVDPIVVLGVLPRNVVPMAKSEVYREPIWGIFPWLWEVIPVYRGGYDRNALHKAIRVLEAGEVLLMAPEGTRNESLQRGKEGLAFLGSRTGSPILPVAVEGTKGFPTLSRERWQQPGARIRIGHPFRFKQTSIAPRGDVLRRMTDEAMYVLASMLSETRRGVYHNLDASTQDLIEFL